MKDPCVRCGNPVKRSKNAFCSRVCSSEAQRVPGNPCEVCGKVTRNKRFCSHACDTQQRMVERPPCNICGTPIGRKSRLFCSRVCAGKAGATVNACLQCGKPISNRQKHCSRTCVRLRRYPPVECIVCKGPLPRRNRRTCSDACAKAHMNRTVNPLYTPEFLARIGELRAGGMKIKAIVQETGLTNGQVTGIIDRRGFRPLEPKAKRPLPRVVRPVAIAKTPKPAREPAPATRSRIGIPEWKVRALGLSFGLPPSKRADVEAVSRAVRAEDPDHPGFRVASAVQWR